MQKLPRAEKARSRIRQSGLHKRARAQRLEEGFAYYLPCSWPKIRSRSSSLGAGIEDDPTLCNKFCFSPSLTLVVPKSSASMFSFSLPLCVWSACAGPLCQTCTTEMKYVTATAARSAARTASGVRSHRAGLSSLKKLISFIASRPCTHWLPQLRTHCMQMRWIVTDSS